MSGCLEAVGYDSRPPEESEASTMSETGDPSVTRRRFVTGAAAVTAAAAGLAAGGPAADAYPAPPAGGPGSLPERADVVIVGAGLAGLTAARRLTGHRHSVVVLEANDRVGGRVWNHDLGHGVVTERGGTFIGPTQNHLAALATELKVPTYRVYDTGEDVYINGSDRFTYSDTGPFGTAPPDPAIATGLATLVLGIDKLAATIPVDRPWDAPDAAALDGETLASYLSAQGASPELQALAAAATRPIFGAEPRELSMLFVSFYIAASGDARNPGTFQRNFDTRGGAQQDRFVGGSARLPLGLAAALGDRVHRNTPVVAIEQTGRGVSVVTARGHDPGPTGDRGDRADAGRSYRLRPGVALPARSAHPALRAGHPHQGSRRLRHAVLARPGLHGLRGDHRRSGLLHL